MTTERLARPSWFKAFLTRYKRPVVLALVLGLLASGCAALLMFASGYLISATAMTSITLFSVMVPVACVQLFGFGRPIARYLERLVSHDWVLRVTSDLRRMLYWGMVRLSGDPATQRSSGEYLSLLADDVAHLQNLYLRVVFPTAVAILLSVGASLLFGWFSWAFACAMALVFAGTAVALPFCSLLCTRALSMRAKELRAGEYAQLTDDVTGATDWVLAGRGGQAASLHAENGRAARAAQRSVRTRVRCLSLASTLLLGAAACAVMWWSGSSFAGTEGMAPNLIAAFVLGFFPLVESIAVLPDSFSQIPVHDDAIARLDGHVADEPRAAGNGAETETAPEAPDGAGAQRAAGSALAVDVESITYAYPGGGRNVLDGISLSIEAGTSVAVLGRSGSGKSTLARCIRGQLSPSQGCVLVGGLPVPEGDTAAHVIAYLGQDPHLFNRTLRGNLTLGVLQAEDSDLAHVLETVGLGEKLASLPEGLDTVVGETGARFSGGQEHRVALARVLVSDAPVVLVDEPFSALDPKTERDLLAALLAECPERTLIVITHHLAQIEKFDRVVFVENGKVELDGSPDQLKHESTRFCELLEFDRNAACAQ